MLTEVRHTHELSQFWARGQLPGGVLPHKKLKAEHIRYAQEQSRLRHNRVRCSKKNLRIFSSFTAASEGALLLAIELEEGIGSASDISSASIILASSISQSFREIWA